MIIEDEIINNINLQNIEEKNDFFGFEASKREVFRIQEENRITELETKIKYAANRVFINHGDSYHGKYIIQEIGQVLFYNSEFIDLNKKLTDHNIFNEEIEKQELNETFNETHKNQTNFTILEKNDKETLTNNNFEENRDLDKVFAKIPADNITRIQIQPKINSETILIYNVYNTITKVKEQNKEPKKYDIITTVQNKSHLNNERYEYLKYLKRIIIPNNKELLMKEIKKCGIVIYDISLDKNQITEAYTALQKIIEEINFIKKNPKSDVTKQTGIRVFILISSIQTWTLTKKENEIPITEADYKYRICHPNFQAHYNLENYVLLLNDKYYGHFYGVVLASGLVYGHGEYLLKYLYETALNNTEQLLIPKHDNNLPIIHIENLSKIVKNLVINYKKLKKPYIIGIETTKYSLRNITEAIKDQVQKQNYVICDYNSLLLNSKVTQNIYDMVTMSIQIVPVLDNYITKFLYLDKSTPRILTETMELINEYYIYKNSKIKNMIINGPHEIRNLAKKLAHSYNLILIDPVTASEEFLDILETSYNNINSIIWTNNFIKTILSKQNNISIFGNKELLEEQKKYFVENGQISDKYLIPFIKNKIMKNKTIKNGYIVINFPETIEQAQNLFNLEKYTSKLEFNTYFMQNEIYPTIIIDVVMVGKNVMNRVIQNSKTKQLQLDTKLFNNELNKSHDCISFDFKYTEDEIMKHILENDDTEIRKNRKLVDYLELLFKPKMYKKYILLTQKNFTLINNKEFEELFETIIISMPIRIKGTEIKNEVNCIKTKINEMIHNLSLYTNEVNKNEEEIKIKHYTQSVKEKVITKSLQNIRIKTFLMNCINQILINGVLEIIKNMPEDPIDFLVEYIYNQNMYNPCVSSPLNKKPKIANSHNKHLL